MTKDFQWIHKKLPNKDIVDTLSKQLNNLDKTLTGLLVNKKIDAIEKAKKFFRPSLEDLNDPFLMKGMSKAIDRLTKAINENEKILIYGDYDVDGTTSVALVYGTLKQLYPQLSISYYIPDRYKEGYGISIESINYSASQNISLIIALDCGIKAIEQTALANKKNIDLIICDHHSPGEKLPKALSILNPKQKGCNYPFKELSGCGVGFKLLQGYFKIHKIDTPILLNQLDLLCISICADLVPITEENRVLASLGIELISKSPRESLLALLGKQSKEISVTDIVFGVAPKINACGRICSGKKAVEMLIEKDKNKVSLLLEEINELNRQRKDLDKATTKEALDIIEKKEALSSLSSTVVYKKNWHKGVVGIVASKLIDSYYRPTIVLSLGDQVAVGSARSVEGYNIYKAIESCKKLLKNFGGHKYAAGLTIKKENLNAFASAFEEVVKETILPDQKYPKIKIDATIIPSQINPKFWRILKQFGPFGPKNMRPVFYSENLDATEIKILKGLHLKFKITSENNSLSCIGFNLAKKRTLLNKKINIVYVIEQNIWNGEASIQLNIKDIKRSEL